MLSLTLNSYGQTTGEGYFNRGLAKANLQDYIGPISDFNKTI
jgi:hypothetical protein